MDWQSQTVAVQCFNGAEQQFKKILKIINSILIYIELIIFKLKQPYYRYLNLEFYLRTELISTTFKILSIKNLIKRVPKAI